MTQKKSAKQGPKSPGSTKKSPGAAKKSPSSAKSPGAAKKSTSKNKTGNKKASSRKSRASAKKTKSSRLAWLGSRLSLFLLGALFGLALLLVLRSGFGPENGSNTENQAASSSSSQEQNRFREKVQDKGPNDSEQAPAADLQQSVRQVDLALVQSLIQADVEPDRLQEAELRAEKRQEEPSDRPQTLILQLEENKRDSFLQAFEEYRRKWLQKVDISRVNSGPGGLEISIQEVPTHRLLFDDYTPQVLPDKKEKPQAKLALVMDDIGQSLPQAKRLLQALGPDVTLSILPYQAKSEQIVDMADSQDMEFLLHLPMEPEGYPEVDPGPGALYVNMQSNMIQETVQENLEQVPGAVGVNNHMGSRFSADLEGMRTVLQELKKQDMFYMDSLTTSHSQVKALAREISIPILSRDVFLDNKQDVQAVMKQLHKAEALALQLGQAIAVGHPYPQTLEALEMWAENRKDNVELVKLSELLQNK
ncbi:MAG: divergent polysaccharide deacetylase family protein [Desulfohalobiaceae bacterium]